MDIESIYEIIKNMLPLAKEYMNSSPLSSKLIEVEKMVEAIEKIGGIKTLSNALNLTKNFNNIDNNKIIANVETKPPQEYDGQNLLSIEQMPKLAVLE